MGEALHRYHEIWSKKPVLRLLYSDFYPGAIIEIGGGVGNLKERLPEVWATDIQFAPWLDCVADAQCLPFAAGAAANIVMVDVLHHIEFPMVFLRETARVLRPGGRLLMIEPAITWGSSLFYRLLHHEPVRMRANILAEGTPAPDRNPYAANQAIPTLLATREQDRFHRAVPQLRIRRVDWFSLAAYPLSGGFKRWSLISPRLARQMLAIERNIERRWGRVIAFRMMLIVERQATEAA